MDAWIIRFRANVDPRGTLTAIEEPEHIPFPIKRVFMVHDVTPGIPRGGHAHMDTDQVIVAAHGSLNVRVTDGTDEETFALTDPTYGLFVRRRLWVDLLDFSEVTSCLVLASTNYDQKRSWRTWDDYVAGMAAESGNPA